MKILIAIIVFSVIILFHELGHFLLAKKNGIKVLEFSLVWDQDFYPQKREKHDIL